MKRRLCLVFLLLLCLACSRKGAPQVVIQENPVRIVSSSSRDIFPASWLSADINAEAEPLEESEIERSGKILNKATKKYPAQVLANNLDTIYVMGGLRYCGISAGGTNSTCDVYIVNEGWREGFTDSWIEGAFHHEFSSILLRNYPQYLDKDAWKKANVGSFKYGRDGVQAVKQNRTRTELDASLHAEGFLCEYGKAAFEEDVNSFAAQLFVGDSRFWSVVDKHPRIKDKTDLVVAFYHKIDPGFSESFFMSLSEDASVE